MASVEGPESGRITTPRALHPLARTAVLCLQVDIPTHGLGLTTQSCCSQTPALMLSGSASQPLWASVSLSEKWEWFGGAVSEIIRKGTLGQCQLLLLCTVGNCPQAQLGLSEPQLLSRPEALEAGNPHSYLGEFH